MNVQISRKYREIPGTLVFDADQNRRGAPMNRFLSTLNDAGNRERFFGDEQGYLAKFEMTPEQVDAVLRRDWSRMVELGGQIFYVGKLAHADGLSTLHVCAVQAGMPEDEYAAMMMAGGRSPRLPGLQALPEFDGVAS